MKQAIANIKTHDRATSDFDIRHRWSFGANYELPWGKNWQGLRGQVLSGWQLNGASSWQTGMPFGVSLQQAVSGVIGLVAERPNRLRDNLLVDNPTFGPNGQYLDLAAFGIPAPFTLGNATRNVGVGPNRFALDASLFKTFKLTERHTLQFRTEVFNVLNHPVFGNPNAAIGNANFGKITSLVSGPRQLQFALKLLF